MVYFDEVTHFWDTCPIVKLVDSDCLFWGLCIVKGCGKSIEVQVERRLVCGAKG